MRFWRVAICVASMPFCASLARAEEQTPTQLEQREILRSLVPLAQACAGRMDCFLDRVRPFGPWTVVLGLAQGEQDPEFAGSVTNFAFGVVGAAADVDPIAASRSFFCGEPCMRARADTMRPSIDRLREIVALLDASGLSVVALWPNGQIRADDLVIDGAIARRGSRTPVLSVFRGWSVDGETEAAATVEAARDIAGHLRTHGLVAIARNESGGVRLIHRDSVAENEQGLLFAPQRLPRLNVRLANGARYTLLERVAPGVYAFIRS